MFSSHVALIYLFAYLFGYLFISCPVLLPCQAPRACLWACTLPLSLSLQPSRAVVLWFPCPSVIYLLAYLSVTLFICGVIVLLMPLRFYIFKNWKESELGQASESVYPFKSAKYQNFGGRPSRTTASVVRHCNETSLELEYCALHCIVHSLESECGSEQQRVLFTRARAGV